MDKTIQLCNWIWWRNRIGLLLLLFSVIAVQLVYWTAQSLIPLWMVQLVVSILIPGTVLLSMTIFTFGSDLDFASGRTAFPIRFFELPVGSLRVAMVPIAGMLLAIAWCWMPAMLVNLHALSEGFTKEKFDLSQLLLILVLPWLAMSSLGCWLQTIAWWPFRTAWHRVGFISFLVIVVVVLFIYSIDSIQSNNFITSQVTLTAMAGCGVIGAVVSVTRSRRLSWRFEAAGRNDGATQTTLHDASEKFQLVSEIGETNFGSVEEAIQWRLWHQTFKVPVLLTVLLMAPIAIAVIWAPLQLYFAEAQTNHLTPRLVALKSIMNLLITLVPLMLLFPAFILLLASPSFGKSSYWKREFAITSYLAGLPVSDGEFVAARIRGVLKTSLATWLVAFVVLALWALPHSIRAPFEEAIRMNQLGNVWPFYVAFAILLSLYLSLVAPWPGLAVGLYGRGKLGTTMLVLFLVICSFIAGIIFQFVHAVLTEVADVSVAEFFHMWTPTILASLLVAKFSLLALGIHLTLSRGHIHAKTILKTGLCLTLICIATTALFVFLLEQASSLDNRFLSNVGLFLMLLFPCSSLLFSRVAFDANRHR